MSNQTSKLNVIEFMNLEIERLIKFAIWWSCNVDSNVDGFDEEMSREDLVEQFNLYDPDSSTYAVPKDYQLEEFDVDAIRSDLKHQLMTDGELDWNYFLDTAIRAKIKADATGRNMTP